MAEAEPQVPYIPAPLAPQAPQQPIQPTQHVQQPQQVVHLNWSYFKPKCLGKQGEDVETHLLRTNEWINMHHF